MIFINNPCFVKCFTHQLTEAYVNIYSIDAIAELADVNMYRIYIGADYYYCTEDTYKKILELGEL